MQSHRRGDLTEAIVVVELKRREIAVSKPVGDNERYDLIAETPDDGLIRIQVKTGWLTDGCVRFRGDTTHTNASGHVRKQYHGDVDIFVVYCEETADLYLVEEGEFGRNMSLRVEEPEVRHKNINWAEEFEFDERWPPDSTANERTLETTDPTTIAGVDALEAVGAPVWRDVHASSKRNVVTEVDGRPYRVRIESGFLNDGRIRVNPDETETDCYVVYCDGLETVYAVDATGLDETFSLRVSEPRRYDGDTKLADEHEIHGNWPPNRGPAEFRTDDRGVRRATGALRDAGYELAHPDGTVDARAFEVWNVDDESERNRIRVENSHRSNGRLFLNANGTDIDHYLVYDRVDDELYVVPNESFDASVSLRVEPPRKNHGDITWADDFRFEDNWPPV